MEGIGFDLSISERNDSIFIHNTENQDLYYLQHSSSDDWKLIEIE